MKLFAFLYFEFLGFSQSLCGLHGISEIKDCRLGERRLTLQECQSIDQWLHGKMAFGTRVHQTEPARTRQIQRISVEIKAGHTLDIWMNIPSNLIRRLDWIGLKNGVIMDLNVDLG